MSVREITASPNADKVVIMKRILYMPGFRQAVDFTSGTLDMCGKLVDYYGDCNKVSFNKDGIPNANAPTYNLCSYRIGFTVVIVIPIIYTAGEISISLINKFKYVKFSML